MGAGMDETRRARDFFRSHADDYGRAHYGEEGRTFMSVRLERVLEMVAALGLEDGARVLDAGCGPGHLVQALAERGLAVWGVDASPAMLAEARRRLDEAAAPARLALASIERLPLPSEHFDLVCSTGVIEYLPGDGPCLAELRRTLRPGGHLVLSVTNALSPVLWADSAVEALKRRDAVRGALNALLARRGRPLLRARHFPVRRHRPAAFRAALADAGFTLRDAVHFHFLPWPRPLDRLLPGPSARLGAWLERFGRGPAGVLAEGYLVSCTRDEGDLPSRPTRGEP